MNMKKLWSSVLAAGMALSMTVTGFAATYNTPAEAAAGLSGKSLETVIQERQNGKTYGEIANDAGKLEEYKEAVLEITKDNLDTMVKNGNMTQQRADELYSLYKERQALSDGTGAGYGLGLGQGGGYCGLYGQDYGAGQGGGQGAGFGGGRGRCGGDYGAGRGGCGMGIGRMGLQDGSCYY